MHLRKGDKRHMDMAHLDVGAEELHTWVGVYLDSNPYLQELFCTAEVTLHIHNLVSLNARRFKGEGAED